MPTIIRRRKLGRTGCREIARYSQTGVRVVRSDRPLPDDDLYIRWGCTASVPARNVINTAEAIHQVNDKLGFRQLLMDHHVVNQGELLCPMTYFSTDFASSFDEVNVIVRPRQHAQGRHLHVCTSIEEVRQVCQRLGRNNYYISELINKVAEYRVFIVQGRAVWVAQKTPGNPNDVAWNVARGGRFDNVRWDDWPLKVVRTAIEAFNLSQLDFGGVDVVTDAEGNAYVLEINSAPSQTSPYRQECTARALDWVIQNGKDRIPLIAERGGYRKFIHPALTDRAQLVGV